MLNPTIFVPKPILVGVLIISAILFYLMGKKEVAIEPINLVPVFKEYRVCDTNNQSNTERFIIYVPTQNVAEMVLDEFCQHSIIEKQFGKVIAYWGGGEANLIQFVGKGVANLSLVRTNIMLALQAEATHGYVDVAVYPDYKAYLISLREKPQLTKQYLWGKKIGLVDYPTSRSGHIVPKHLFQKLGLSVNDLTIIYANSHTRLREMLLQGEVDIISSYWKEDDNDRFSDNYKVEISEQVSGSRWYMRMDAENTDLYCASQKILIDSSSQQSSSYFNRIYATNSRNCKAVE
ncbi:PhnD/SsuA/transferrin family substrate-binding protein [Flocculibacter collagenilyticus]|uniref:PhnD/SsuA/transferrin family substrate-binding protein n=1 Tax=Flocculibacter collagenilyticus TaxID=2744479 RepID=UPI0018F32CB9|nr:PhnD/SsuA/transferrin family substrate-binding protein [Flocculibacter collagenilyticus]